MRSHDHFSYLFACKGLHEKGMGGGEEGNISECLVHLLQGGDRWEESVSFDTIPDKC